MDLSFGLSRERRTAAEPVRLDFPRLIAILAATQAASRTAGIADQLSRPEHTVGSPVEALVALFDAGRQRGAAQHVLAGSFNPAAAGQRR